ncbi:TPA: hypothetical protein LA460_000160 [Clostridium botulinum]|nr:hypothetical protein [Clostridium botulinum]HBJ1652765.1 hypothetical protein [Clostridium botulinum]
MEFNIESINKNLNVTYKMNTLHDYMDSDYNIKEGDICNLKTCGFEKTIKITKIIPNNIDITIEFEEIKEEK